LPTAFSRSSRALEAEGFRFTAGALLLVLVLLGGWGAWFFLARVSLYAVSDSARLEVDREAHAVEAAVGGRVAARSMRLGQEVTKGDVLLELDAEPTHLLIEERGAERAGLLSQRQALERQLTAQRGALGQARQGAGSALAEARSRYEEAEAAARFAEEQATRTTKMHEQGLVSDAERKRVLAESEQRRAAAAALKQALARQEADRGVAQSGTLASVAELERQKAELDARIAGLDALRARLSYELGLHQVKAPVSGHLGDVVSLQVGSEVQKGQRLGTIIPSGEVRIVAEYAPSEAAGRVRAGQPARLRLRGFPWIQFGMVEATVTGVAEEARNGTLRVELAVQRAPDLPGGLQHGLPGSLEIEVERIAPALLVLRAAGRAVSRAGAPSGS
jgi:membrane fusion protein (multidrug efflux system)